MPPRPERRAGDTRYFLGFAGTASLLVAGTLVLVLYVLPQRYVLSSGFREGSLILPDPTTPFEPLDPRRIAALPLPGTTPGEPDGVATDRDVQGGAAAEDIPEPAAGDVHGPAEVFWDRVLPLIEARRWDEAIDLFTDYLTEWPDDRDVRREYALTLAAAGYGERAVPVLEGLLEADDDPEVRLVLARVLRDDGRTGRADVHYAVLLAGERGDEALWLERGRAHAWVGAWIPAEDVLREALSRYPHSIPLRVELARLLYSTDRLEEAGALLASMDDEELEAGGALGLRDDVDAALTPPEAPEPEPTVLELAVKARVDGDLDRAEALFRAAIDEGPDDPAVWQAWADFLQYERLDLPGALAALREVERLGGSDDAALQFRMAQLGLWTGDTADARARLEGLLAPPGDLEVRDDQPESGSPTRADVLALLGDLDRWDGDRVAASRRYADALAVEPDHEGASEGQRLLLAEVQRALLDAERPRLGGIAESLADTDDFLRVDLGGEWSDTRNAWVWGVRSGGRMLSGRDLTGAGSDAQGAFAEVEGARWWRLGTVRTGLHGGVQTVRSGEVDVAVGASVRLVGGSGRRTDVRFDHEPAFGTANTLQAVLGDVRQDRLLLSHTEPVGERWVAAASVDAAAISHEAVAGASDNTRLQGGLSVGRVLGPTVTVGLAARALTYADAAPAASGLPLYWDPELSVSVGPYVQLRRALSTGWELGARLDPGASWIVERGVTGGELVPDLSARLGVTREGAAYRTSAEVFYGQGRFTGYRSWGIDLSFGARLGASR